MNVFQEVLCESIENDLRTAFRNLGKLKEELLAPVNDPAAWANETLNDVMAERQRQIDKGLTREHDDKRVDASLVSLAGSLLGTINRSDKAGWVWNAFKKVLAKNPDERRTIVITIAVLMAELERRDRITLRLPSVDQLEIVTKPGEGGGLMNMLINRVTTWWDGPKQFDVPAGEPVETLAIEDVPAADRRDLSDGIKGYVTQGRRFVPIKIRGSYAIIDQTWIEHVIPARPARPEGYKFGDDIRKRAAAAAVK